MRMVGLVGDIIPSRDGMPCLFEVFGIGHQMARHGSSLVGYLMEQGIRNENRCLCHSKQYGSAASLCEQFEQPCVGPACKCPVEFTPQAGNQANSKGHTG